MIRALPLIVALFTASTAYAQTVKAPGDGTRTKPGGKPC